MDECENKCTGLADILMEDRDENETFKICRQCLPLYYARRFKIVRWLN